MLVRNSDIVHKYKTSKSILFYLIFAASSAGVNATILTGDSKLACEAIICLNPQGHITPACHPSLARFHTITAATVGRLLAKRAKFLRKCPVKMDIIGFLKSNKSLDQGSNYFYKKCIAPYGDTIVKRFGSGQCTELSNNLSLGEKNRLRYGNKTQVINTLAKESSKSSSSKWSCSGSDITFSECTKTNAGFICFGKKEMPQECKDIMNGLFKKHEL